MYKLGRDLMQIALEGYFLRVLVAGLQSCKYFYIIYLRN
jgi:hypothetical protein